MTADEMPWSRGVAWGVQPSRPKSILQMAADQDADCLPIVPPGHSCLMI